MIFKILASLFSLSKRLTIVRWVFSGHESRVMDPGDLPRKIFIYWDKGLEAAPDIVKICIESWFRHNPEWEVHLLDDSSIADFFPRGSVRKNVSTTMFSDLLRTKILYSEGGVWVDATCLCTKPLDVWLPFMFCQSNIFLFSNPGRDRVISNWFIASTSHHEIIRVWHERLLFLRNFPYLKQPYFSAHFVFEANLRLSRNIQKIWRHAPSIGARAPHVLQNLLVCGREVTPEIARILRDCPVHKLTYKSDLDLRRLRAIIADIEV